MHITIQEQEKILVHYKRQAQVGTLLFDKAPTKIPAEYSDYSNIFSTENIVELPENIEINEYAIELEESKQPPFGLIYNLGLMELIKF